MNNRRDSWEELTGRRMSRAGALRRIGAGGTALLLPSALARGAWAATSSGRSSVAAIPEATVRLGLAPYADASLYVIGARAGWFKDVGISISPAPLGRVLLNNQTIPALVNGQIDIAAQYGSDQITTMVRAPQ